MKFAIYVQGVAGIPASKTRGWIESHEDTLNGRGATVLTSDKLQAKPFESPGEAFGILAPAEQDCSASPGRQGEPPAHRVYRSDPSLWGGPRADRHQT